jgi:hypothetical protein
MKVVIIFVAVVASPIENADVLSKFNAFSPDSAERDLKYFNNLYL